MQASDVEMTTLHAFGAAGVGWGGLFSQPNLTNAQSLKGDDCEWHSIHVQRRTLQMIDETHSCMSNTQHAPMHRLSCQMQPLQTGVTVNDKLDKWIH